VLLVTLTSQIAPTLAAFATPNQKAVAAAQDTAFNSGLPNIPALYGLSLGQVPSALDQLSGEVHPSTAGVLVDESQYARNAMLGRLRQAAYGGNSQMASLSMGGPQAFAAEGSGAIDSALAYAKSPMVTKAPMQAPAATSDVVFWGQGFGARGRFDSDGNAANVRRDLAGFFSGVDTRVALDGRLGIAAGYSASRNALDGRGLSNVETGHVSGYGGWAFGNLNLRAGGAFAWHSIETNRAIVFPGFFDTATASYNGRTGQIFGETGYGFAFGNVAVEPFAGGAWVRLQTDGFTERAAAAGLVGAAQSVEVGYSTLGVRAASMIPIGADMVLIPRASLAWQHAFNDVRPEARLAFIAAPAPFVIGGTPIARDSLLSEAGLDLAIGRNAIVGVSYTGQVARNVQDHAAKGKFSWKF
jgi:outer membrane autotransporter protein